MYISYKSKLACTGVLITTMLLGCGDNKTPTEYLAEAKVAFDKGERNAAIISLKNVLKADKNNIEARFLLGSIYMQQGLWLKAEKEFRRAEIAGRTGDEIKLLLIKVNYRLDNKEYLNSINSEQKYSNLAKLYTAILELKENYLEEGRAILDEIVLVNENDTVGQLAMAWDSFLNKKYQASLTIMDSITKASIIQEDIIELRVANLVAQNKYKAASEQLELFLSIHPDSHTHRLQLASNYAKARNYSEAEKNTDLLLTFYENHALLNRIKAEIKFNARDYVLAKEFAEIALRTSEDVLAKVIAGMSAYQLGQYESSYSYLSTVKDYFPEKHPVNTIVKSLTNQLTYRSENGNEQLPELVTSLIQSGDYQQTRAVLQEASKSFTSDEGVTDFRLGLLKVMEGDTSFVDDFKRAISNGFEGIEPKILLAQEYLQKKEYSKVLEIANSLSPNSQITANLLRGGVFLAKQELESAIAVYENILSDVPQHQGAMFKLSEAYYKAGNTQKSQEYLQKIYTYSASNFYAVRYLFKLSLEPAKKRVLEQFFIKEFESDQNNVNRQIVLAEFYLLHNEFEQALVVTSRYLLKSPAQLEMTLIKTRALLSLNRIKEAEKALNSIENKAPNNPEIIKNKAFILNVTGKKAEAIKVIEKLRTMDNNALNDDLLIMLSTLYIESKKIPEAEGALNLVKNQQGTSYDRVAGKIALIKGNSALAIKLLSRAQKRNASQLVTLELAQAFENENQVDEAIQLLESYLLKSEDSSLILVKYKLAALNEKQYPLKAEMYYKQLLSDTGESVVTLNNIAWLYYTQQRYEEGKKFAMQALEKSPNLAAIHNTLGVILLELGELSKAHSHLTTSVDLDKSNANYKVWLAKSFKLNDDVDSAQKLLRSIDINTLKPRMKMLFNEISSH